MAFLQQQQRPQAARQISFPPNVSQADTLSLASPLGKRTLEESEEWVIFSPSQAPSVVQTATTSTERTPRTHALSRFSDFGSLDTAARSDQIEEEEEDDDDITEHGSDQDEEAELDSLDDGLHAFHEPDRLDHSGGAVLPTHDGLGSFGDVSQAMQQQMWQFEREAPRRAKLRRMSSVQRTLDILEQYDALAPEHDRTRRIEQWRLEQSRALLEEIERETRRMHKISRVNTARSRATSRAGSTLNGQTKSETPFASTVATPISEHPPTITEETAEQEEVSEGFWHRFTQKVIRSLIGIDENLLSIILGEDLIEDAHSQSTPSRQPGPEEVPSIEDREAHVPIEETWQHRLMVRIARELGMLVNQMSEHPGAFSTYMRTQEVPAYAGLPNTTMPAEISCPVSASRSRPQSQQPSKTSINQVNEASLWGIEEESDDLLDHALREAPPLSEAQMRTKQEQEYWEKDMDVKMVFNFLKDRFSSQSSIYPQPNYSATPSIVGGMAMHEDVTTPGAELTPHYDFRPAMPDRRASVMSAISTPYSARRAALIRQHHPLTSRNADTGTAAHKRLSLQTQPFNLSSFASLPTTQTTSQTISGPSQAAPVNFTPRINRSQRTASSRSCASQSTKISKRSGSARGSRQGRNFWDSHSNSAHSNGVMGGGGLGTWGEV